MIRWALPTTAAVVFLWAGIAFLGLQTFSIDGVTVFYYNIPHLCGLDWCPS